MPSLRSSISLADTKRLQRLQTPRNPVYSTAEDIFDTEYNSSVQTIVNQSDELAETGKFDNTDAESWQGLSNSEFEDLDYVLSRATSIAIPALKRKQLINRPKLFKQAQPTTQRFKVRKSHQRRLSPIPMKTSIL
jgi:hypothetical protein